MKLVVIIFSLILLASCDCGCDPSVYGKHKFKKGDIVHHKVSNEKILITDTVRDMKCYPAYDIVNSGESHDYFVSEVELK